MVKKIPCFEDSSGVIHREAFSAHRADLAILLGRSEDISDTSAKKLAERLAGSADDTDELIQALQALQSERPAPAPVAADARCEDVS